MKFPIFFLRVPPVFLFVFSFFILIQNSASAAGFKWKNQQTFRYDTSVDNEDWYIIRFSGDKRHYLRAIDKELRISPFLETRYHFYLHKLHRTEAGLEVGIDLFKWLYWGESLQYASLHPGRDTLELESILRFTRPFKIKNREFEFYLFEEHTFAFVIGEGKRNEIGLGFNWPVEEGIRALLGWRHIDRIHYYDSDQIEASLIFNF